MGTISRIKGAIEECKNGHASAHDAPICPIMRKEQISYETKHN